MLILCKIFYLDILEDQDDIFFNRWNVKIYGHNNNILDSFIYDINDYNEKRNKYVTISS